MVNLKNLKNVKFTEISEKTKIEANIGFTIGIFIGTFSAWILILLFTEWQWYFKVFSSIGSLGILGSLAMTLMELFRMRRNYIETMKEMEKMNAESKRVINENVGEEEKI